MIFYILLLLVASPLLAAPPNPLQQLVQSAAPLTGQILGSFQQQSQPQQQSELKQQGQQQQQPFSPLSTASGLVSGIQSLGQAISFPQALGLQAPDPLTDAPQFPKKVVSRGALQYHPVPLFIYFLPAVNNQQEGNVQNPGSAPIVSEKVQQEPQHISQQQTPGSQYQTAPEDNEALQGKSQQQYQQFPVSQNQHGAPVVQGKAQQLYNQYQPQQIPLNQLQGNEGALQGTFPAAKQFLGNAPVAGQKLHNQFQQQSPINQFQENAPVLAEKVQQQGLQYQQYAHNQEQYHQNSEQQNQQHYKSQSATGNVPVAIVPQTADPQKSIPFQTQQQQQTQQYPIAPSEKIIPQAQQQVNQQQGQSQVQEKSAGSGPQHLEQQQSTFASQQLTNIQNTSGEYHGFASQQEAAPQISSKSSEFHGQPQGNVVAPVGNVPVHVVHK